jgi:hypothetical protein
LNNSESKANKSPSKTRPQTKNQVKRIVSNLVTPAITKANFFGKICEEPLRMSAAPIIGSQALKPEQARAPIAFGDMTEDPDPFTVANGEPFDSS